jgi:diguanylate cyclase (GGDEF)-like protein/PAS domain S-box-containing protein
LGIRIAFSGLIALAWVILMIFLIGSAGTEQRELLIYLFSGLMAASVLLSPSRSVAFCFLGVVAVGSLIAIARLPDTTDGTHLILFSLFAMMMGAAIWGQGNEFVSRVLTEIDLEDQREIVGLLLRDFEESASDWMWETDRLHRFYRVSDRMGAVFECPADDLKVLSLADWCHPLDDATDLDEQNAQRLAACLEAPRPFRDIPLKVRANGRTRWVSLSGKPVFRGEGEFLGFRGVGSDITAAHVAATEIARLAHFDTLTGLPNRASFHELLGRACQQERQIALLVLDLDGFKIVNDSMGHGSGDGLLIATARRLRSCLTDGDMIARLGGDEFAILHVNANRATAGSLAERIVASLEEPFQIAGAMITISTSIGIAMGGPLPTDPGDLLKHADLALYHSKGMGRRQAHFFDEKMAARAVARNAMQADLRVALEQDGLSIQFQPIIDLNSGEIIAAEALARWTHPVHGPIPPSDFIPVAENFGLINALGTWVLKNACHEAARWPTKTRVAVNLSPVQFRATNLLGEIDLILAESGLAPSRLELEITESVFLEAADATLACLFQLKERGIHIALDDFGTGYSSLSYLRSFPFDRVKIDRSFINDLNASSEAFAIVRSIVDMVRTLGMNTTAEGVETAQQAEILRTTGCTEVQGYWYGRPCSPQALGTLLSHSERSSPPKPALVNEDIYNGH